MKDAQLKGVSSSSRKHLAAGWAIISGRGRYYANESRQSHLVPYGKPDKIACPGEGKYFIIVPLKKENPLCISSLGEGVLCSCASDTQLLQTCSFRGKDLVIKKINK